MSATNRGAERAKDDFYVTPRSAITPIVEHIPQGFTVVDAGCGTGAIGSVLREHGWDVVGVEKDRDRARAAVKAFGGGVVYVGDFLTLPQRWDPSKVVIVMNPPYSDALAWVQRALEVAPNSVTALLRLNFLGSLKRRSWLRANPPNVYVLPRRPSFGNGRTDATEYAWFQWPGDGQCRVL